MISARGRARSVGGDSITGTTSSSSISDSADSSDADTAGVLLTSDEIALVAALNRFITEQPYDEYATRFKPILDLYPQQKVL